MTAAAIQVVQAEAGRRLTSTRRFRFKAHLGRRPQRWSTASSLPSTRLVARPERRRSSTRRSTTRPRRLVAGRLRPWEQTLARSRVTTLRLRTSASSTPAGAQVSIPILNKVPVAQISPANTAVGLTSDEPGADKGEPDKYYPTGDAPTCASSRRTPFRARPWQPSMKKDGCTKAYILNDKEVYGAGLSRNIEISAKAQGLKVAGNEGIDPKARTSAPRRPRSRTQGRTASCSRASPRTAQFSCTRRSAAVPDAKLYGPDGVAESGFVDHALATTLLMAALSQAAGSDKAHAIELARRGQTAAALRAVRTSRRPGSG